jgi:hypothetical protein
MLAYWLLQLNKLVYSFSQGWPKAPLFGLTAVALKFNFSGRATPETFSTIITGLGGKPYRIFWERLALSMVKNILPNIWMPLPNPWTTT